MAALTWQQQWQVRHLVGCIHAAEEGLIGGCAASLGARSLAGGGGSLMGVLRLPCQVEDLTEDLMASQVCRAWAKSLFCSGRADCPANGAAEAPTRKSGQTNQHVHGELFELRKPGKSS